MLNNLNWNGDDIPDSFFKIKNNEPLYQLIKKIKEKTNNTPSKIRSPEELVDALKTDDIFYNKHKKYIEDHLFHAITPQEFIEGDELEILSKSDTVDDCRINTEISDQGSMGNHDKKIVDSKNNESHIE